MDGILRSPVTMAAYGARYASRWICGADIYAGIVAGAAECGGERGKPDELVAAGALFLFANIAGDDGGCGGAGGSSSASGALAASVSGPGWDGAVDRGICVEYSGVAWREVRSEERKAAPFGINQEESASGLGDSIPATVVGGGHFALVNSSQSGECTGRSATFLSICDGFTKCCYRRPQVVC
jgi:hypothetical protein